MQSYQWLSSAAGACSGVCAKGWGNVDESGRTRQTPAARRRPTHPITPSPASSSSAAGSGTITSGAPDDPMMQMHIGMAPHKKGGDTARADLMLKKALNSNAKLPDADEARLLLAQK